MDLNRAYASLEKKLSSDAGYRVDLQLADVKKINNTTAHFMLEYGNKVPTSEDISQFFIRQFNAKVTPFTSTAKVFDTRKAVTVVAQLLNITRDIEDIKKKNMKPVIAGYSYIDVPMDEIWKVESRNGEKVLVKKVKDNIMAIVESRKNAMLDSNSRLSFAKLAKASLLTWLTILEKGDQVRALVDEKVVDCEVVAATDGEVKVKYKNGSKTIPRQSIVEIVSKNKVEDKKDLTDYYTEAYGDPKYAEQLTRT